MSDTSENRKLVCTIACDPLRPPEKTTRHIIPPILSSFLLRGFARLTLCNWTRPLSIRIFPPPQRRRCTVRCRLREQFLNAARGRLSVLSLKLWEFLLREYRSRSRQASTVLASTIAVHILISLSDLPLHSEPNPTFCSIFNPSMRSSLRKITHNSLHARCSLVSNGTFSSIYSAVGHCQCP